MMYMHEHVLKNLDKYHNSDLARRDITNALEQFSALVPKWENYVFQDGSQNFLVNLSGTIPVEYKGQVYHIPICVWVLDTHPENAPICYVKPTANMEIKVSYFVDFNGKIYLPYLHDWNGASSDLVGLIQVMICTFGEQPPVYAKPSNAPYPTSGFNMPQPSNFPYPQQNYNSGSSNYPPYFPPYSMPSSTPYPSGNISSYPSYPPQPSSNMNQTGTITEEHIRASLLSAVEDKLRRRLREQQLQFKAELDTLRKTHQELTQGKQKLDEIMSKLEKEKGELDKNITILEDKEKELTSAIERLANQESIDVDEAVTTTAPLYKQLLNAYAEEAATEDTIYYMGEALRHGVIDLDVFLKQVRALSRKQFMLRALMQKCRQKAGLAG